MWWSIFIQGFLMVFIKQTTAAAVWPIRHKVMYPDMPFDSIKLPEDKEGIHLALYEDDKIISVISLFLNNNELQFRKFATVNEYQGKGYGTQLLSYVLNSYQCNIARIWCNARKTAVPFYRKFGFEETNECYRKNGIDYVIMERWNKLSFLASPE